MELDARTFAKAAILVYFLIAAWGNRDLVIPEREPPPAPVASVDAGPAPSVRSAFLAWAPPPVADGVLAALAGAGEAPPRVLPAPPSDAVRLERQVTRFQKLGYKNDQLVKTMALGALRKPLEKVWRELTRALDRGEWDQARELAEGALRACEPDDLLTRRALLEQLIQIHKEQGDIDKAKARADEAVKLFEQVNGMWGTELAQHGDRVGMLKAKGIDMLDGQKQAVENYRRELAASIQAAVAKTRPAPSPPAIPTDISKLSPKAREALDKSSPEFRAKIEQWLKEPR
jgi:hypothetical protein